MIDSHCHLAGDEFDADRADVLRRARDAGLAHALVVLEATEPAEHEKARDLCAMWDGIWLAAGVHPHRAGQCVGTPDAAADLARICLKGEPRIRAIGEIGLDYHYDFAPRALQRAVFEAQVGLAGDLGYPVIIHTREADADTLAVLRGAGAGAVRGVFHCFSGDATLAAQAVALGFHVSFSGILTFKKSEAIRAAAAIVPMDRLLIETDSPYLAPVPHRGTRNEPAFVTLVAASLAAIKGVSVDALARAVTDNFAALFLPPSA